MSDPIDMIQLVRELPSRPRGRACIVLTHEYRRQKAWAVNLARQTNSVHIDLLDLFADNLEFGTNLRDFSASVLFERLRVNPPDMHHHLLIQPRFGYDENPVVIISGFEFLKATWVGQPNSLEQFSNRVETWEQSPCLVFVVQYDKLIATRPFRRYRQYTFVVDQKETLAL